MSDAEFARLLDEIAAFYGRFIASLSDAHFTVLALFTAHTYVAEAAAATPYMHVTSPELESGKTRVLEVADLLTCKPSLVLDPSAASLYRGLASKQIVTLLIDEIDNFLVGGKAESEAKRTILGILNGGYRRGLRVPRADRNSGRVEWFSPFGPKMLCGIGELPRTLASRSVRFPMRRRRRDEPIERFRRKRAAADAEPIVTALIEWAASPGVLETLESADPGLPDELGDREQDVCEPLVAIADLAGEEWARRARDAFVRVFAEARQLAAAESNGVRLLSDLRDAFEALGDRAWTTTLLERLIALDDRPWGGWSNGNGLGPRNLANLLRPFDVRSRTVRIGEITAKGYSRADFQDAFLRYLPPVAVTYDTTVSPSQKQAVSIRHTGPSCDGYESAANPHHDWGVTHVTATEPRYSENGQLEPRDDADTDAIVSEEELPF